MATPNVDTPPPLTQAPATPPAPPTPGATPPPAPPAAGSPPADPPKPEIDPWMQKLGKVLGKTEFTPAAQEPEIESTSPSVPLGELMEFRAQQAAQKEPEKKEDPPAAPTSPAAPAPAAGTTEEPPVKLRKPIIPEPAPSAPPAAPAPSSAAAPPAKPQDDEAKYIEQLTPQQKREIDLAQLAEETNPEYKGFKDKLVGFYKKVDQFHMEHPGSDPQGEEFQEFVTAAKPQWKPGDRELVIEERAVRRARGEMSVKQSAELEEIRRKTHELEVKPLIDSVVQTFGELLTDPKGFTLPEGTEVISPDVAKAIREQGYEKAVEQFPIEAPVYASSVEAAREFVRLTQRVTPFNQANETHRWLSQFITSQERTFAASPEGQKPVNGRTFTSRQQFTQMSDEDRAKHWCFGDNDVLDWIGTNANLNVSAEYKRLERGGIKRQKATLETKPAPAEPAKPVQQSAQSPIAGASSMPGASRPSPQVDDATASFMRRLPGGVGQKFVATV